MNHDVNATWRVDGEAHASLTDYLLYRRHRFAYEQAIRVGPAGGVAIDIACGLGYALEPLSEGRRQTLAIDLAWAPLRSLCVSPRISKVQANAARLPFPDDSINLVVAFQLIEHVEVNVARQILQEIQRVLASEGMAFITTPNSRWRLLPGQRPWNPYHIAEYSPRSIVALCRSADLRQYRLRGVVGRNGAQERELARVRQDPLSVYGGRAGLSVRRIWDSAFRQSGQVAGDAVEDEHKVATWFELTDEFASGLDFWIELRR
jgi:SAM-dependent methyltransferase